MARFNSLYALYSLFFSTALSTNALFFSTPLPMANVNNTNRCDKGSFSPWKSTRGRHSTTKEVEELCGERFSPMAVSLGRREIERRRGGREEKQHAHIFHGPHSGMTRDSSMKEVVLNIERFSLPLSLPFPTAIPAPHLTSASSLFGLEYWRSCRPVSPLPSHNVGQLRSRVIPLRVGNPFPSSNFHLAPLVSSRIVDHF